MFDRLNDSGSSRWPIRHFVTALLLLGLLVPADAEIGRAELIRSLKSESVSRLEWGIQRYRHALVEMFRIDPITFKPHLPPFFINVDFQPEKQEIVVEIGRTFGTTIGHDTKALCTEYLVAARSQLGVDRNGRAVVNGVSRLAEDYFYSPLNAEPPTTEFASAIDQILRLRGLVVAPLSGDYTVCTTPLVNAPISFVE